jgi:hypothetical protein
MPPWLPPKLTIFDFEYEIDSNGLPNPVCVVATTYETTSAGGLKTPGVSVRMGWEEIRQMKQAPWDVSTENISVAYSGHGDLQCFDQLGWPRPRRFVDLMIELRWLFNGVGNIHIRQTLYNYLDRFGIHRPSKDYKSDIRDLIISGRSHTDKPAVLDYCESDVTLTAALVEKVFSSIDWRRAIVFRGEFMQAISLAEARGLPVDVELLSRLVDNWPAVQAMGRRAVNRAFGVPIYDGNGVFKLPVLETWLDLHGMLRGWPRTLKTGRLKVDDDILRDWSKSNRPLRILYEARRILDQGADGLRLDIGADGRCRTWLNPFGTKTARNAPRAPIEKSTKGGPFLFAGARWVRGLLKPEKGRAIAYIDWTSQEIFVAAVLSNDANMLACYFSADPYMTFAIMAGAAPPTATKKTHKDLRAKYKTTMLGLGYGMGAAALAHRLGTTVYEAETMIRMHKRVFRTYWDWSTSSSHTARETGWIQNPAGWRLQVTGKVSPTTLQNWPIQSAGAAMLQVALPMIERAGVKVLASVHDAVLIESDVTLIDAHAELASHAMEQAGKRLLRTDLICRTDPKIVKWPDRFMDDDGAEMFQSIMRALPQSTSPALTLSMESVTL